MEPKRELTSVDLAALETELRVLAGATLQKAYEYDDDRFRLKLRHPNRGRVELFLEVGEEPFCYTVDPTNVPDAPERPTDFARMLRNRLGGRYLDPPRQYEFDRILEFPFTGEEGSATLVVELFGDGNLAVLEEDGRVVDCLRTVRLQSRTVAPGRPYEFPRSRLDPLAADREALESALRESDTDVVRTLATQWNLGGRWAEELCTRAGVEKVLDVDDLGADGLASLLEALETVAARLADGDLAPELYREPIGDEAGHGEASWSTDEDASGSMDGTESGSTDEDASGSTDGTESGATDEDASGSKSDAASPSTDEDALGPVVDVAPFPMAECADLESTAYDRFLDALEAYVGGLRERDATSASTPDRPDFEAEIDRREHILEQQRDAIERYEAEAAAQRQRAELLYAHYDLVDGVIGTIRDARAAGHGWDEIEDRLATGREQGIEAAEAVLDLDPEAGTVTVAVDEERVVLEVAEGLEHNADRLYREAKRIEEKADGAREALEETRAELAEWEQRREEWTARDGEPGASTPGPDETGEHADTDAVSTDGQRRADADWLAMASVPIRERDAWYERFRWFHTGDGFLVIGGRNAKQNEELVRKYLEPGDRVFHTQAHGGPVTVLKATDPGEPGQPDMSFPEGSREQAAQFAVSYSSVWKDGRYAGDVYEVDADQVSKTAESGEYLETGGFAVRGDRTYHRDTPVGVAVGIQCEPVTGVIGGPPVAIEPRAVTRYRVEPGRFAQPDVAKRLYRRFREDFADQSFVRKIASPDAIQHALPPGGSRIVEE